MIGPDGAAPIVQPLPGLPFISEGTPSSSAEGTHAPMIPMNRPRNVNRPGHLPAVLAVLIALAGCTTTTDHSQYQTPGRGGWDNFRADAIAGWPVAMKHT